MLRRITNIFKGFVGLFVSNLERKNPEALLEVEKENLRKQLSKFNIGLANHAGLNEKLLAQVKKLEKDMTEFKGKASVHLKSGNQELAGQYALKFQKTQKELLDKKEQLSEGEKIYKDLVKSRDQAVKAAKDKIEALKSGIDEMRIKQASAELNEMAAGLIGSIGGGGDNIERLQSIVEDEKYKASGKARVARDGLESAPGAVSELEEKALAEMALADFAAAEGIVLNSKESTPSGSTPTKTMGPSITN